MRSKARRAFSSNLSTAVAIDALLLWRFGLRPARTDRYIVQGHAQKSEHGECAKHRLEQPLPYRVAPRNDGVLRQSSIAFGIGRVMQNINYMRAADRLRIVDARLFKSEVVAQLFGTLFGDKLHVIFTAKLQAAGWASFDASWLQALTHAVGAERTLVNFLCRGIKFRDVVGTSGDAELAANAVFLLEVHDAVCVLHDGAIGGGRSQAGRIGAVHALVFAHQPLEGGVSVLVLVELDQVPEVPARFRHRLVSVVECRRAERHVVPLDARHLASLAADTGRRVDQLADFVVPLHVKTWRGSGVSRDLFNLKRLAVAHIRATPRMSLQPPTTPLSSRATRGICSS